MNILKAVKAFDRGKRIRRNGWHPERELGFERGNEMQFVGGWPSGAYEFNGTGTCLLYSFTLADIRAEDWEICK